jgi:hypothetical protein
MSARRRALPSSVLGAALALGAPSLSAAEPLRTLERSDESSIVFTVRFDRPSVEAFETGGRAWQRVVVAGCVPSDRMGWPEVPVDAVLVGIPPDATVASVTSSVEEVRRVDGPPLPPVPTPVRGNEPARGGSASGPEGADPEAVPRWALEPAWPAEGGGGTPAARAELLGVSWWRNHRVARIAVHPVRTIAGEGGFEFADAVRVTVTLRTAPGPSRKRLPARFGEDRWDSLIDSALLNGPESRGWLRREGPAPSRGLGGGDYFSSSSVWLKIRTRGDGVARVTGAELASAGAPMPIDAAALRLFVGEPTELSSAPPSEASSWMREVPILVEAGADGRLDATSGDYIAFFGASVDAFRDDLDPSSADTTYVMNQYGDARVFWLAADPLASFSSPPLEFRQEDVAPSGGPAAVVTTVRERRHIEQNTYFNGSPRETGRKWEKWWWNSGYSTQDFSPRAVFFSLPGHVQGTTDTLICRFWGITAASGLAYHHELQLGLNGTDFGVERWNGLARRDILRAGDLFTSTNNLLSILVVDRFIEHPPDEPRLASDTIYLAFLDARYERALRWDGSDLFFRGPGMDGPVRYRVTGLPAADADVFDVSDPWNPIQLLGGALTSDGSSFTLEFERVESAGARRRYLVTRPANRRAPVSTVMDTPPAGGGYLRARLDPIDYIVVYYDGFEQAAMELADLRGGLGGILGIEDPQVLAVRLSDVFDEFSWGMPDPTAIRNFFWFAYTNYGSGRLTHGVLLGDADFDHRDFETAGAIDYVPAWSELWESGLWTQGYEASWPADDYMGSFDDAFTDLEPEIAVGRIPAQSSAGAAAIVDKIARHTLDPDRGEWMRRAIFVADDICQGDGYDDQFYWTHTRQADGLADRIPDNMEPVKIYLVDYPDPVTGLECRNVDKPSARDALVDAVNDGAWLVDYVGHGGESVLADEHVLVSGDVPSMRNDGRYHCFVTASCSVGKFDDAREGLGETIVKQDAGGAVASFSAAAVASAGANVALNSALIDELFQGSTVVDSFRTFGEASVLAKTDILRVNSRKYNVLGDPAVAPAWPNYGVALELLLPDDGAAAKSRAPTDTLWRGSLMAIRGTVVDGAGTPQTGYSGTARLRVYDSAEVRSRDAPAGGAIYELPGATIYRGDVPVQNGQFVDSLFVPVGLRRGVRGPGAVRCRVEAGAGGFADDAIGSLLNLTVSEDPRPGPAPADSVGPFIEMTFEGPPDAVPIGSTMQLHFEDPHGIYIAELLDSRSVVVTFEDLSGFVVHLENLSPRIVFDAGYREADTEFRIPVALGAGRQYVVKVRASDNLGNRTTVEEEIYLVASASADLQRVFVYPNPTASEAAFFVDFNRPAEVEIKIHTVTGKRVRTITRRLGAGEGRTRPVVWDLRDADGDQVANGSYFYLMEVRSDPGTAVREQGWVAVLR